MKYILVIGMGSMIGLSAARLAAATRALEIPTQIINVGIEKENEHEHFQSIDHEKIFLIKQPMLDEEMLILSVLNKEKYLQLSKSIKKELCFQNIPIQFYQLAWTYG